MAARYPRPEVLARMPASGHAVIEASAGTGKTFTLEHLVVDLILGRGIPLEEILVVTFTEKATAELRVRLRRIFEGVAGREPAQEPPPGACWTLDDAALARVRAALARFDRATISTIHGFCQRVLLENAFAGRRLLQQEAVDERAAFSAAFRHVLRRELSCDEALRPYLVAWLERPRSEADLEDLLWACHQPRAEIRPAFDRAALEAALAAFRAARGGLAALVDGIGHASTRKAVGQRLRGIASLAEDAAHRGLAWFLGQASEWHFEKTDKLEKASPRRAHASALHRAYLDLEAAFVPLPSALAQLALPLVRRRLAAHKEEKGLFDFHDMLALVQRALDGDGGELLVRSLRARYRYALIDEFQDTDEIQWRVFERLFFDRDDGGALFLIGDPKQAIYGFRGADVQTYLAARERIRKRSPGALVRLTENHRSTARLVEACNRILDQSAVPSFFRGDISYDAPVTCGRPGLSAIGPDGSEVAPIHLFHLEAPAKIAVRRVRRVLAARIAQEIRAITAGGLRFGERGAEKPLDPSDVFVLTRTTLEGLEVGRALREAGVDHAFYKQDGLFQSEEAAHVLDLLLAVDDPHDRSRRYQAWITPFFDVRLDDLPACSDLPGTHPLVARLFDWRALAEAKEYERLFSAIVEESGIARRALFEGDAERALTNVLHIFELLLDEVSRTRPSLRELTGTLQSYVEARSLPRRENGNVQRLESERHAVQVMTLHKAKGLEAPAVFLFGGFATGGARDVALYREGGVRALGVSPRRPGVKEKIESEDAAESQRLLYVGMTRARARLYLPYIPDGLCTSNGSYQPLNERLRAFAFSPDPSLFSVEKVPCGELGSLAPTPSAGSSPGLWRVPAALRVLPDRGAELSRLGRDRAGFVITSYTRMSQGGGGHRPLERADLAAGPAEAAPVELTEGELPPGRTTGVFLHEVLERIDLDTFQGRPKFAAWSADERVQETFRATMRRHDIDSRHAEHARRLVYAALAGPVRLGGDRLVSGLASCPRILREMEFVYPFPERAHPRLGAGLPARFEILRGYVRGFVDLVFEERGLAYLADWKSDALPSFAPADLAPHVREHYHLQAQLYALALVKMLGVRSSADYEARFGGILYCFLRGMQPDGDGRAGVSFERPSWDELAGWEEEILGMDPDPGRAE
jgi:exodeoxyribonuclease V beta subunit